MVAVVLGMTLIGFQNFTPHLPFKTNDVSHLYMNGALSTALNTKEKESSLDPSSQQIASHRPLEDSTDSNSIDQSTERAPQSQSKLAESDEDSLSTDETSPTDSKKIILKTEDPLGD